MTKPYSIVTDSVKMSIWVKYGHFSACALSFLARQGRWCEYMPVVSPIATVGIDAHVPEGGILPVNGGSF